MKIARKACTRLYIGQGWADVTRGYTHTHMPSGDLLVVADADDGSGEEPSTALAFLLLPWWEGGREGGRERGKVMDVYTHLLLPRGGVITRHVRQLHKVILQFNTHYGIGPLPL